MRGAKGADGTVRMTTKAKPLHPGRTWRILCQGERHRFAASSEDKPIEFDEVVVGKWLHVERMSTNHWWMRVGDDRVSITVGRDGRASKVTVERGEYPTNARAAKPRGKR